LTFNAYLAPGIYAFLFKIARENVLSVKEVETILLRQQIRQLGFNCDHMTVVYPKKKGRKDGGKPFCKECWTRMEEVKPPAYDYRQNLVREGKYRPLETFLDRKRKQNSNAKVAIEQETTA
jgi:peptide subunit release factor 1 (eRF1)